MDNTEIKASKGLIAYAVASIETIDSSGEVVKVAGVDISDFKNKKAPVNIEHLGEDDVKAGKLLPGTEVIGQILTGYKVFGPDDFTCNLDKICWEKYGVPFIAVWMRLYDGAGHIGAQAVAAQIRDGYAHGNMICGVSIEGHTLSKRDGIIEKSIAKKLAFTNKACNKSCDIIPIYDPNAPRGYSKYPGKVILEPEKDSLDYLVNKAEPEIEYRILTKTEIKSIIKAIALTKLEKAITGGGGGAAPSTLVQDSALQKEYLDSNLYNMGLSFLRDFDDPIFTKEKFKSFLKSKMPEVGEGFIEHFSDLAEKHKVKLLAKKEINPLVRQMESILIDLRTMSKTLDLEDLDAEPTLNTSFTYHRDSLDEPDILEYYNGNYVLNGFPITEVELERMLFNIENEMAVLKYKRP